MPNLLVLVAGTTLDYCVKVLLIISLDKKSHTSHTPTNTYLCWLGTGGFSD